MMKTRKPWVAAVLSLLCPGLGQFYNGDWIWPLISVFIGSAMTIVATYVLFDSLVKLVIAIVIGFVFDSIFAVHAYYQAKRVGEIAPRSYHSWWGYILFAALLYAVPDGYGYLIPRRFLSFEIPSQSMVPTLLVGDRLVADGWAFLKDGPKVGDVIVFDYPQDHQIKYVKRVIGLPGDEVSVKHGRITRNGTELSYAGESQTVAIDVSGGYDKFSETIGAVAHAVYFSRMMSAAEFGPIKVPEGKYFVMGDNRDRSSDSRVWGFVKREEIIAKMSYVYFSWDPEGHRFRSERVGEQIQ